MFLSASTQQSSRDRNEEKKTKSTLFVSNQLEVNQLVSDVPLSRGHSIGWSELQSNETGDSLWQQSELDPH
jgi:hypothetical protein